MLATQVVESLAQLDATRSVNATTRLLDELVTVLTHGLLTRSSEPRPARIGWNGEVIWHHDVRHPLERSRQLRGFHTPAALHEALDRDFEGHCRDLAELNQAAARASSAASSAQQQEMLATVDAVVESKVASQDRTEQLLGHLDL